MPFLWATVPADLAQCFGHLLRIAHKLAYLYSWPDLLTSDSDDLDDATESVLTLFIGVMFGTQSANAGVGKVAGCRRTDSSAEPGTPNVHRLGG